MKQLKDFPDYYITENAEVISRRCKREKKLNPHIDHFGYLMVGMRTSEGKTKTERIHRLMMLTYGGDAPKGMKDPTVDHINGDKLDNRIDNLQWLSNKDNAYKSAKDKVKTYLIEDENGNILEVENLNKWCKELGLDPSSMRRSNVKGWRHKGYRIIEKLLE